MTNEVTKNLPCARNHLRHPLCDHLDFKGKCFYVAGVVALVVLGILTLGVGPLVIYGLYKAFSKKSPENDKSSEILRKVDPQRVQTSQPSSPVPKSNPANLTFVIEQPNTSGQQKTKIEEAIKKTNSPGHYFVWSFNSLSVLTEDPKDKFNKFCEDHKQDTLPIYFVAVCYEDSIEYLQELKKTAKEYFLKEAIPNCLPDPVILGIDPSNSEAYKAYSFANKSPTVPQINGGKVSSQNSISNTTNPLPKTPKVIPTPQQPIIQPQNNANPLPKTPKVIPTPQQPIIQPQNNANPKQNIANLPLSIEFSNKIKQDQHPLIEKAIKEANLGPAHYFIQPFATIRTAQDMNAINAFSAFYKKHENDEKPIYLVASYPSPKTDPLIRLKPNVKKSFITDPIPDCKATVLMLGQDPSNPTAYKVFS